MELKNGTDKSRKVISKNMKLKTGADSSKKTKKTKY